MEKEDMKQVAQMMADMLDQRMGNHAPQPAAQWGQPPAPIQPAGQWGAAPATAYATPQPTGVMFRFKIQLPDGSALPGYLMFGPEVVANPQALPMVAAQIAQIFPIDRYQPNNGYQNGGGYQNGNGWNGGGYRNGGGNFYRRGWR